MTEIYDPLNLQENALRELLRASSVTLDTPSDGGGVYALFYKGGFPLYQDISGRWVPIYIGSTLDFPGRLRTHIRSLVEVGNLNARDFTCRVLRLAPKWNLNIESEVIAAFDPTPWWNRKAMTGFGNNAKQPLGGVAAPWDCVHRGRKYARGLQHTEAELVVHLASEQPNVLDLF
jgi:hypothetical protein